MILYEHSGWFSFNMTFNLISDPCTQTFENKGVTSRIVSDLRLMTSVSGSSGLTECKSSCQYYTGKEKCSVWIYTNASHICDLFALTVEHLNIQDDDLVDSNSTSLGQIHCDDSKYYSLSSNDIMSWLQLILKTGHKPVTCLNLLLNTSSLIMKTWSTLIALLRGKSTAMTVSTVAIQYI